MTNFIIQIIKLYQKILSPDHGFNSHKYPGGYCKFRPTCSDYAILSLNKYGLIKGLFKTSWRILRCNPFSHGGLDLP